MSMFRDEFHAGWRNLIAATVGASTGIASFTASYSLFFRALEGEFGWSKTATATALAALPLSALVLPFVGALIDRIGVRLVAGAAIFFSALGYFLLAKMRGSTSEFYVLFIALNVLGCAAGPVAYTRLIVAKFRRSRGTALAVSLAGMSVMAASLPPVIGFLITTYSWRTGYLFLSLLVLTGGTAALFLMQPTSPAGSAGGNETGVNVRTAIGLPSFWLLGTAVLFVSVASIGLVSQFQSVFLEREVSAFASTILLSAMAVSVTASRLVVGRLLDSPSPHRWAAATMALASCGAFLLLERHPHLSTIVAAVILLGFSLGAEIDLMAYFCGRLFGLRHYGAIYGIISIFFYTGMAVGGIGYGAIRDFTGTYDAAILATGILLFLSAGLFLAIGKRGHDPM
jgi:MFS family permease